MTDACIICQTEPIEDNGWYVNAKTLEVICSWCVEDMHYIRKKFKGEPK